jgi:hypothetical protein
MELQLHSFFDLGTRWYPLDRRLGEPQSRSGHGGEDKNSQPLPGLEPPIIQPVALRYTTELSGRNGRQADRGAGTGSANLLRSHSSPETDGEASEPQLAARMYWFLAILNECNVRPAQAVRIVLLDFIHRLVSQEQTKLRN